MGALYFTKKFCYTILCFFPRAGIQTQPCFHPKQGVCVRQKKVFKSLNKNWTLGPRLWFDSCASLGELDNGRPIIEELKKNFPIPTFSLPFFHLHVWGYKKYDQADHVCYLPWIHMKMRSDLFQYKTALAIFVNMSFVSLLTWLKNKNTHALYFFNLRKDQLFLSRWRFFETS